MHSRRSRRTITARTERIAAMRKFGENLPPDVERYVDEGKAQGLDEGAAWAVAWSRWCKYKSPGDAHCSQGPDGYFQGRKAAVELYVAPAGAASGLQVSHREEYDRYTRALASRGTREWSLEFLHGDDPLDERVFEAFFGRNGDSNLRDAPAYFEATELSSDEKVALLIFVGEFDLAAPEALRDVTSTVWRLARGEPVEVAHALYHEATEREQGDLLDDYFDWEAYGRRHHNDAIEMVRSMDDTGDIPDDETLGRVYAETAKLTPRDLDQYFDWTAYADSLLENGTLTEALVLRQPYVLRVVS